MRLTFLGASGTVTGSRYLLAHDAARVLIDCGLFQGLKQLRLRNWAEPTPAPNTIDAVVLTHAHLDHSGYLPRLVRLGYSGPIYCTRATHELAKIMLPDSGRLQEEEAEYANRKRFSKHKPALPLYTEDDALRALKQFHPVELAKTFAPATGMESTLSRAGHLLGAASVQIRWAGGSVLFSGDLGRADDLVMRPPEPPPAADTIVVESTYGNRLHDPGDVFEQLAEVIRRTAARGGVVIVPAFAVGRAQTLMYCVRVLKDARRIPNIPIFLNSPMAADVTRVYHAFMGEHRLTEEQCRQMCTGATIVNSVEESKRLNSQRMPMIIISASGMATGGRVLHHLRAFGSDHRNTILFTGFQAAGTRGAALVQGAREIKIHGDYVPIRAEILNLQQLSAHADRDGLLQWLGAAASPPRRVFVTHGEPEAADALRHSIGERLGCNAEVPEHAATVELG